MKIVIINSSLRKNGATAKILNEFADRLKAYENIQINFFHLADLKIDFCKGCCNCYKTGACHIEDDAKMLSEEIAGANGLIIGSPNYVSGVSGKLKTFIDRGHFVVEQLLTNVSAINVVTYENFDGKLVEKYLKKLFVVSGANYIGGVTVKIPFNENPLDKKSAKKQISKLSSRLHYGICNKQRARLYDRIFHAVALKFVLKPLVRKKGDSYNGVIELWKKRGILL